MSASRQIVRSRIDDRLPGDARSGHHTGSRWYGCLARAIRLSAAVFALAAATGFRPAWVKAQQPVVGRALPASIDLRPQFKQLRLEPRSQGDRPTCSVFTTTWALEFALSRQLGKGCPLSVEYLNWACNQVIHNRADDRGQFFHDLIHGYEAHGICREGRMPYRDRFDPRLGPSREAVRDAAAIKARGLKITWIKRIGVPDSHLTDLQIQRVKRVLAKGWPVAAGSGHSRLLVGYRDDDVVPGGGVFITKDSGLGCYSEVSYAWAKANVGDSFWAEPGVPGTSTQPAQGANRLLESPDPRTAGASAARGEGSYRWMAARPGALPTSGASGLVRTGRPAELQPARYYYLEHKFSGRHVCTGATTNGEFVHLWGPIPPGDADRYQFQFVASGEKDYYYLIHRHSGKYLCTGETANGAKIHLWGPIPPGHQDRYQFKLVPSGEPGCYFLVHKHSGKFLCSGFRENAGEVYLWGPIPPGREDHCMFRLSPATS